YTNLKGKIDLQPDKVHIDEISVLDNWQSALSLTGDLAVHEGQVGDVRLYVTARDFKVIDNKMGNVRVDSDMELTGDLASPRLQGTLDVNTGQLNVDEILASVGDSAYATEPTEYLTRSVDVKRPGPKPSAIEALKVDVQLSVPNDLVVKGQNLQTAGSPVGLG